MDPTAEQAERATIYVLLVACFNCEDGSSKFLKNTDKFYTVSHPRMRVLFKEKLPFCQDELVVIFNVYCKKGLGDESFATCVTFVWSLSCV